MSIFSKAKKTTVEVEKKPCEHMHLAPRWENAADMGKRDRVTSYVCDGCGQNFTPAEADAIAR